MNDWKRPTEHSMKRRAPWHDYRAPGTYMLTMAVDGRRPLLGRLVFDERRLGETIAENRRLAHVALSPLGEAIRGRVLRRLPEVYPQVEVWRVCIMPDHIHLIVRVREALPEGKHLGHIVAGFKRGCHRAAKELLGEQRLGEKRLGEIIAENRTPAGNRAPAENGTPADNRPPAENRTPAENGTPADNGTPAENRTPADGRGSNGARPVPCDYFAGHSSLFEKGYNDRLLFDGAQLDRWKHYLDDNPRRLALKRLRPDLFTVMHGRRIGRWECQLVGNIFLLDIPDKAAVIVHRADSDEVFAQKKAAWLACGERGGVIVSAAISKREKEVMREAMERGYFLIFLKENGFPELYKPSGEAFNACSRGQLLQVSPWPYHTEERTISREQCLELNRLAEEIAAVPEQRLV